jgi:hypothetical protein
MDAKTILKIVDKKLLLSQLMTLSLHDLGDKTKYLELINCLKFVFVLLSNVIKLRKIYGTLNRLLPARAFPITFGTGCGRNDGGLF